MSSVKGEFKYLNIFTPTKAFHADSECDKDHKNALIYYFDIPNIFFTRSFTVTVT